MNIHLPAILGFTRYQGFDTSPYHTIENRTFDDVGWRQDNQQNRRFHQENMDMEATGMWVLAKTNGDFCSTSPGGPNTVLDWSFWTWSAENWEILRGKGWLSFVFFWGSWSPATTQWVPSGKLTLWKITIFNGKIHYKWWFSIAMLNYQRVKVSKDFPQSRTFRRSLRRPCWLRLLFSSRTLVVNFIDMVAWWLGVGWLGCPHLWGYNWLIWYSSGWWFQRWILFSIIYGMSSFPLTNSYFSRWLLHHQPVIDMVSNFNLNGVCK